MKKTLLRGFVVPPVLLFLLALVPGRTAHAAVVVQQGCAVSDLGVDLLASGVGGDRLFVNCGGKLFNGNQNLPGQTCAPQDVNVLKVFLVTLLASMTTGKVVNITYEDGGTANPGCNGIYAVDIFK